ncbi:phosphonate metabolism protein/1,5-bisphosphokinase (PRPP-forming) PhnN [Puia dinghuensis]|uniref:Ribose 1,5-bisphosphate phosphokinase PhnN n=1 Tax=Puia dinghuensis TaxID=1792502 RepID=A0A8J2UEP0_9BACT|nr:phosphonate metabolism protein/1,5-bisphosphokinase (PRPP-forming) PhnN [Puia dinghuensis]GGB07253.1 ribose 1,5-bisphosphate phosphokinase PhnN [Puia dinghuensis]
MTSRLIYIIGASGVGKDALMQYARQRINGSLPVLFAHRYITRDATEGSENHIAISPQEFRLRRDAGLFALHWESHDLYYGIGLEIESWMNSGLHVVVNGSRQYLPVAAKRYQQLTPIIIEADEEIIRRRLETRGRETADGIATRIKRQPVLPADLPGLIRIANNGTLEEGGDTLVRSIHTLLMVS